MKCCKTLLALCVFYSFSPLFSSCFNDSTLIPSAGIIEREIEQEYEGRNYRPLDNIPGIQIDLPENTLDFPEGIKVRISYLEFCGNETFNSNQIYSWVAGYLQEDLSIKNIYELCQAIDQCYMERGFFLTRAYPPPQEIENETLCIEIIEGRLGNVTVQGNCFYSDEFIKSYFDCLINRPIKFQDFEHALLLLNDNCDLKVRAVFEKGEEYGTGDLVLIARDCYPAHLYLNANNYGQDLTTNTRAGARLDWGNFLRYGDLFSLAEVVGFPLNAMYFTDVSYITPLDRKGTFVELSYLASRFEIEELKELHLRGRSEIATVGLWRSWIRKRFLSVDLFSYFDFKQIPNYCQCRRTSFDKLRILTFGFNLDHLQPCAASNYLAFQFGVGLPNFLGGLSPIDKESSRKGAGGRVLKFNLDYARLQCLPYDCFLYFHTSGQWSPYKLTLPELFYIGGESTVRGYPLAVGLGDSGYFLNLEFRFPPPFFGNKNFFMVEKPNKEIFQLVAFFDHGGVFLKSEKDRYLCGTGVGLRIHGPYCTELSLDVGFPLNSKKLSHEAFVYIKLTAQPF